MQIAEVPGEFVGRMHALATHWDTASPVATGVGIVSLAIILSFVRYVPRVPGTVAALVIGTVASMAIGLPARDHRHEVRRHPGGPARTARAAVPRRARAAVDFAGADRGTARGDRVVALGRRVGPHDRRQAQPQRRTHRPGRRQRRVAPVRRAPGHRRHRTHGHQHPVGRQDARRRDDPRRDAARRPAVRRAARAAHPAGRPRRHPLHRRVEHGRVEGDPAAAEAHVDRHQRVDGDVRADRARRPHHRRRSRDDHGRAALHPARRRHDHRGAGDRALRARQPRPHAAGQGHPELRRDLPHPRAVPVRHDRQDRRHQGTPARHAADHRAAPAQHDGARCDGRDGHRGSREAPEGIGADAAAVRRTQAAGRGARARRHGHAHRPGQRAAARGSRRRARAGDSRGVVRRSPITTSRPAHTW